MKLPPIFRLSALAAPIAASVLQTNQPRQEVKQYARAFAPASSIAFPDKRSQSPQRHQARQCGEVSVTFNELVTTLWGESVLLVGDIDALGKWDNSRGVALSADEYTADNPQWSATVSLSPGTSLQYKYIRVGTDGSLNYEGDPNHSYTVPGDCTMTATVSNTWQYVNSTAPSPSSDSSPTVSLAPAGSALPSSCTNGPTSRGCWSDGYDIETDFDRDWPSTGKTVSYDFTITNTTISPDGFERQGFAINGQFPGPTIYADWGDQISVTFHNELQDNGTNIHWHGLRLWHANSQDGVPGVTECPIAPEGSKTYTFTATQYGTSWYHSHFSAQYGDGVWGPIVVNGPASANYDIDLGPFPMQDWYYPGIYVTSSRAQHQNAIAPTADNGLINGTMVSPSGGAYSRTTLSAGKKHRLRLLNTGVDNHFQFSLDGHTLTVIAADFVPIVPYNATWIFIAIGQRYDVIIDANQTPGSYWFRAEAQDDAGCGTNFQNGNIRAIFSYEGHETETPSSSATAYSKRCTDETNIVPYWNSYIPRGLLPPTMGLLETNIVQQTDDDRTSITVYWPVNDVPLQVDWSSPTLQSIRNGQTGSWPERAGIIELPTEDVWTYWVMTEAAGSPFTVNIPHPIHLHGHDFYVLGWGNTAWQDSNINELNYDNPPRRDTTMLPTNGWVAIAFHTNNPGAW